MNERTGVVKMKGNELTLIGDEVQVTDAAADCLLVADDLSEVKLSSFRGKISIICSVPSLDTPVCDTQTRKFNEQAVALGDDVVVLCVSMDLPFAQSRFCAAAGIDRVITLSDHRLADFGQSYGVLIKGLRLLARAVFVVDREGIVRYVQIVPELTDEPDYEAAIDATKKLLK